MLAAFCAPDGLPRSAIAPRPSLRYGGGMAFELIAHTPVGDVVLGSYDTRIAAEKLAAIAIPPGERWSVVEVDGNARPAAVIDFAAYRAKRKPRSRPT